MDFVVDGRKVFAATGGVSFDSTKPVMVFIHGAGMDRTVWGTHARFFAHRGFAVLALDLPGHGRSEGGPLTSMKEIASWIVQVLDAVEVASATLVGHSMGGSVALETAANHPSRVDRLILMGTAPEIPVHPKLLELASEDPSEAYRMMTDWSHGDLGHKGGQRSPGTWVLKNTLVTFGRSRPGVLRNDLEACAAWDTGRQSAASLSAPSLVITGRFDRMTREKVGRELAELIPGAQHVSMPDAGHSMMNELPDETIKLMAEFVS
ncbi:MAG: alpha/beta hydrolase [Acidimicrobiia bacterium]|nr:alpha/beta hydrolase [Acidimicrobiia bacterium]